MRKVAENGHAVVVVAEGTGEELMQELNTEADKSGNKKLQPIAAGVNKKPQPKAMVRRSCRGLRKTNTLN